MDFEMETPNVPASVSFLAFWKHKAAVFVRCLQISSPKPFQACLCASLLWLCVGCLQAATPLNIAISSISASLANLQTAVSNLSIDQAILLAKFNTLDTGQCALLVTEKASNGNIPISFVPSKTGISDVQVDLIIPSSFTITAVSTGTAAVQTGKSVQFNVVGNTAKIIVFGLNQTAIGSGNLLNISYTTTNASVGFHPIVFINPVASDSLGNTVPLCVTSGGISL